MGGAVAPASRRMEFSRLARLAEFEETAGVPGVPAAGDASEVAKILELLSGQLSATSDEYRFCEQLTPHSDAVLVLRNSAPEDAGKLSAGLKAHLPNYTSPVGTFFPATIVKWPFS